LPIYDEYLVAYRDRTAVPHVTAAAIDTASSDPITFRHAMIVAGQVAGTWRVKQDPESILLDLIPVRRLTRTERRALEEAAERYRRFIRADVGGSFRAHP